MKVTRSVSEGGRSTTLHRESSRLSARPRSRFGLVWIHVRCQVFKFHFWLADTPLTLFRGRISNSHRASFVRPKMKFEDLPPTRAITTTEAAL